MMSFDENDSIKVVGLEKLLKALKAKPPVARVGILASKTHYAQLKPGQKQPKHAPTNAEVGAAHEFGSPARGLPQRSFLRIPISEHLEKYMVDSGALGVDEMQGVLKDGTVIPWMTKVAKIAEQIVFDAFNSGGFGKWPAWQTPGYENNTGMVLVDTTQLRNSITSEVK